MFSVVFKMFTISPHAFFNPLSIFSSPFSIQGCELGWQIHIAKLVQVCKSQVGWILADFCD
jgi:hypothetical protein